MREFRVQIKKTAPDKQIAYGEVYVPMVPDSQGDYMTAAEIERVAHAFLRKGTVDSIDTEHNLRKNGCRVVESFIARKGDPDFIEGSWVIGLFVPDKSMWQQVLKGELGGFSMYGSGQRVKKLVDLQIPDDGQIYGVTQKADNHEHEYFVEFDDAGKFIGGRTNEVDGHSHDIVKGTSTQDSAGHRHRFNLTDALLKCDYSGERWGKKKMRKDDMSVDDLPPNEGEQDEAPSKKCKTCGQRYCKGHPMDVRKMQETRERALAVLAKILDLGPLYTGDPRDLLSSDPTTLGAAAASASQREYSGES